MIGSLGTVPFEVAENYVSTFDSLSFSKSASYAEHKIIGRDPILEFTGRNSATCSFSMNLDASLGVNPKSLLDKLENMMLNHEAANFILDGQPVGSGLWVIESLNENMQTIDSSGGIIKATVNVSLKEYIQGGITQ